AIRKFLLEIQERGRMVSDDDGMRTSEGNSSTSVGQRPAVLIPRAFSSVGVAAVVPVTAHRRNAIDTKPALAVPVTAEIAIPRGRGFDLGENPPEEGPASVMAVAGVDFTLPRPRPNKFRSFRSIENLKVLYEVSKYLPGVRSSADLDEWSCLTEAIYFEARGESVKGQVAVAEVVLNRRDSPGYPGTICEVVDQGIQWRGKCQFSYNCDGLREVFHEKEAHRKAAFIAGKMLNGFESNVTKGALFFHSVSVRPGWSQNMIRTATIGNHKFFN
ncbi:MAG: cell wall hydrolase, partial [Rhodobacteraceae bacterium]|nr:cell wall hydrolase [Paracoccaceae bacterium]